MAAPEAEPRLSLRLAAFERASSTRKYTCPRCGLSVRATRAVRVKCVECDEELTCELP